MITELICVSELNNEFKSILKLDNIYYADINDKNINDFFITVYADDKFIKMIGTFRKSRFISKCESRNKKINDILK